MTFFAWNRVVVAVAALFVGAACASAADTKQCPEGGDYLAKLQKKPAHLEFVECNHKDGGGEGESWLTKYKVKGVYALQVESYLVQNFHMKRLKKSCCAWDGPDVFYSRSGEHFNIGMASDEDGPSTAFTATRADWRKLPFFYVTVEYYK
jgi:hypothetical protein